MPAYNQGGGGRRAVNVDENDLYALDRPFDATDFDGVNELLDLLFRNMTKAKTEIDAIDVTTTSSNLFNKKIVKTQNEDHTGSTTFSADADLIIPILIDYSLHVRFGCQLWSSGNGTQGGMKIRLNHSATAAVFSSVTDGGITTAGSEQFSTAVPTTGYSAATNSSGQPGFFKGWVGIDNVTVAGNLNIEYANQGAGGAWAAQVRRGSWVEYFYTAN